MLKCLVLLIKFLLVKYMHKRRKIKKRKKATLANEPSRTFGKLHRRWFAEMIK